MQSGLPFARAPLRPLDSASADDMKRRFAMSLWDEIPQDVQEWGVVEFLKPVLEQIGDIQEETVTEGSETWKTYSSVIGAKEDWKPLDLSSFRFVDNTDDVPTALEFPKSGVTVIVGVREVPADTAIRVDFDSPRADLKAGFLRAAVLDAESGVLRENPDTKVVKFLLPSLRVRFAYTEAGGLDVSLARSTTSDGAVDIFDVVRMEPPHALIGPGEAFGFGFRAAVLDLSGNASPDGLVPPVPSSALASAKQWQGLWLPEARIFVTPPNADDLRVHGGVQDLWIGFGEHAGVTGLFDLGLVDVGTAPVIRVRAYGPSDELIGTAVGADLDAPDQSTLLVDATSGFAPYDIRIRVGGGADTVTDRVKVDVPTAGSVNVVVTVTDAHSQVSTKTIAVRRPSSSSAPNPPPTRARLERTAGDLAAELAAQEDTSVLLSARAPEGSSIEWVVDGTPIGVGTREGETVRVEVPLAAGDIKTVSVRRTWAGPDTITAFFRFFEPQPFTPVDQLKTFAAGNTSKNPASDRNALGSPALLDANGALPVNAPSNTDWKVYGYASFEGDPDKKTLNDELSARRAAVLKYMLEQAGQTVSSVTANGFADAASGTVPKGHSGAAPPAESPSWWRATAERQSTPGVEEATFTLTRPAAPPAVPDTDPVPETPSKPGCFRKIGVRCELRHGEIIRLEIYGEFDVQTALEDRIAKANNLGKLPDRNPGDGIWAFVLSLRLGAETSGWLVEAKITSDESDTDGLLQFIDENGSNKALNLLGALAVATPLLAEVTPDPPTAGGLVPVGALTGIVALAGGTGLAMQTQRLTVRGATLRFGDGPLEPGSTEMRSRVGVLFDVETAFRLDLGIIEVAEGQSLTARYRAVGIEMGWGQEDAPDGTVEYIPLPVFDPSEGYTIDIPRGALTGTPPLDNILEVLGGRVSRSNPTYIEVEVGLGADTGVLTVDTARVRVRLDEPSSPELTGLGATIDIPGVLRGSGELSITDDANGFRISGRLDVSLSMGIRGAATVTVRKQGGDTGVLVGLELSFPTAMPLASTGLGIYGFLGGLAVNHDRVEDTTAKVPALKWFRDQMGRSDGIFHADGWRLEPGNHAFAAGVLLGTMEGGFILHLKGLVMIEVPGPRILFVMKASLIRPLPALETQQEAALLAVLDVDFPNHSLTIGIVAEFEQEKFITIRAAITASFPHPIENWYVDIGDFEHPVTVKVLDLVTGTGYFMIHGDGIPDHPEFGSLVTGGLTIAVGFHVGIKIGGGSLYLKAEMGWAALVTFDPFGLAGVIYARGELRLFVISIGASAKLTAMIGKRLDGNGNLESFTWVHGEVCGHVDLWLFEVSGCVSLEIGDGPAGGPDAPELISELQFVSQPEVPIEGMATSDGVDAVVATAHPVDQGATEPTMVVPIDALPVIALTAPPKVTQSTDFDGIDEPSGPGGATYDGVIERGEMTVSYELKSVRLSGNLDLTGTAVPSVWWLPTGYDRSSQGPSLALFSTKPTPVTEAIPYGNVLVDDIEHRWGSLCAGVETPAPYVWTFAGAAAGERPGGWDLVGVPTDGRPLGGDMILTVTESWRSGNVATDRLHGAAPAVVLRDGVPCDLEPDPVDDLEDWSHDTGGRPVGALAGTSLDLPLAEVLAPTSGGLSMADHYANWSDERADEVAIDVCVGAVLRSPSLDRVEPGAGRDPAVQAAVAQGWNDEGFRPSDLENGVRFHVGAADLSTIEIVAVIPVGHELGGQLPDFRMRCLKDGRELFGTGLGSGQDVNAADPLPAAWFAEDAAADQLHRGGALAWRQAARDPFFEYRLFRLRADVSDCDEVEIGWERRLREDGTAPEFFVIGAAGILASSRDRFDFEVTEAERSIEALEALFGQDPAGRPLLVPNEIYTLEIEYDATSDHPEWAENTEPGLTRKFIFQAKPDGAPTDLSPFVLSSTPSADESDVFFADPLSLALVSGLPARIFAAYGRELVAKVWAASGDHPTADDVNTHEVPLAEASELGVSFEGAWQRAVSRVVTELDCVDDTGAATRHIEHQLPMTLEPHTDYLLDVVARHATAPDERVWRVGFSTGRYATAAELAGVIRAARVDEVYVADASPLLALTDRPTGAAFDEAFTAAGLDVLTPDLDPHLQVLWHDVGAGPTPFAVVVNAPSRIWRSRKLAALVEPGDGSSSYRRIDREWLGLEPAVDPNVVTRIVRHPGETRGVALLSGAGVVGLDLVDTRPAADGSANEVRYPLFAASVDLPSWERV